MLLDVAHELEGEEGTVDNGVPDLLRILLDDREPLVDLVQTLVSKSIGLVDVGSDIFIGLGEIGKDGLCEAGVTLVGEVQ